MVRRIHDFDPPDRFLAGAIGRPGSRAFYLQASRDGVTVSVALEKLQVATLADRLVALLAEVQRRQGGRGPEDMLDAGGELVEMPTGANAPTGSNAPAGANAPPDTPGTNAPSDTAAEGDRWQLVEPVEEAFRAGTLSLAWDGALPEVVIEAMAVTDDEIEETGLGEALERPTREWEDDDPSGPDLLRVHLTAEDAAAFARAAQALVVAGRPPCPLCGQPLDPQGHLCPRRNGHTPRLN